MSVLYVVAAFRLLELILNLLNIKQIYSSRMLEQGVTCCSGNKPIDIESTNVYSKIAETVAADTVSVSLRS